MNDLVEVNNKELKIKEYAGIRVVTFKEIDSIHERVYGTARRNFNTNKERFIEGVDYFVRNSFEAKDEFEIIAPNGLKVITESGYLMLVKSFDDDLAWDVQRDLVNKYFRTTENPFLNMSKELQAIFTVDKKQQELEKGQKVLIDKVPI
ncbi:ORF6N domain-containing protein [Clostridioides mangenotii]|uniref:ORF6N domain-containing protein n=1 Tax=Metaclostridioides mangenotii TaxID=1540 RepID=UPI002149FCFA|nr:ORF6N domain-containing protein [Clostridioides mangenotii]MCR1953328.1 ORF6N domain-containing protein [Clostridioides mangenotii]